MPEAQFFTGERCTVSLIDIKPKMNTEGEKRIRFDFKLPLTATALKTAPDDVKESFYAISKDGAHLNPIGISTNYEGVIASFFATEKTKTPSLELSGCTLQGLEVSRPENKKDLDDGDVKLSFHMNVPASREAWNWAYMAHGTDLCAVFEEMQPVFPQIKEANPNGDGQGILNMEKSEPEPTVVKQNKSTSFDTESFPTLPDEQKKAVADIKPQKKKASAKKAKAKK